MTAVLLAAAMCAAAGVYHHLDSNIRTMQMTGGGTHRPTAGHDGATAVPHVAENILVMGSDTRASAVDCKIGGDCASQQSGEPRQVNADVQMLVHISADRSNVTVMSIPRDTIVRLPACKNPRTGASESPHRDRINGTLTYGPSCTVAAVHQLTGIAIDHFMMIDFAGVVHMSDAVGGVPVCVSDDVYDPYSHLKLSKGTHTLKGLAALEFLRTRHGFGNGGDIGRTVAQHLFLSSMLRRMESASTLANPVKVYGLADAATKAVTVDTGLGSIKDLVSLAGTLRGIPSDRMTFLTMPTVPTPGNPNTVDPAPSAQNVFRRIRDDVSFSRAPGHHPHAPRTHKPAPTSSDAPDFATTAKEATGCAPVGNQQTVAVGGVPMTPQQAYAASSGVRDSAP